MGGAPEEHWVKDMKRRKRFEKGRVLKVISLSEKPQPQTGQSLYEGDQLAPGDFRNTYSVKQCPRSQNTED